MKQVVKKLVLAILSSIFVLCSGWTAFAQSDIETTVTATDNNQVTVTVKNISNTSLRHVETQLDLGEELQLIDVSPAKDELLAGESHTFTAKVAKKTVASTVTPTSKSKGVLPNTGEKWVPYLLVGLGSFLLALVLWKYKKIHISLMLLALMLASGATVLANKRQASVSQMHTIRLFDKDYPIKVTVSYDRATSQETDKQDHARPEVTPTTELPSQPAEEVNPPVEQPSQPTEEVNPTVEQPNQPTEEVKPPVEQPNQPTEEVNPPVEQPSQPAEEVNPPVEQPSQPTEEVNPPVEQPSQPTEEVNPPVEQPSQPTEEVNPPVEQPSQPTEEVKPSVEQPSQPTEEVKPPVEQPNQPTEEVKPPVEQPAQPKEIALSGYAYTGDKAPIAEGQLTLESDGIANKTITTDVDGYAYMHLIQGKDYRLTGQGLDVTLRANAENDIHIDSRLGQFSLGKINRTEEGFTSLKPSVIQLDDIVDYRISDDGQTVTLPGASGLKAGDVIVLPSSPNYPSFSALKLLAVQEVDGALVIQVTPATLEEVLDKAEFKGDFSIADTSFTPAEGVELSEEDIIVDLEERASGHFSASKTFKVSKDGVTYSLRFSGSIGADINLNPFDAKLILTPNIDVTAKADFKKSASYSREFQLGSLNVSHPTGIGLTFDVYIFVDASGQVHVTLTSQYNFNAKVGYWNNSPRFEPRSSLTNNIDINLKGYAKIGPKLNVKPTFFGLSAVDVYMAMGLGLDGQFEAKLISQNLGVPRLKNAKGNLTFFADLTAGYNIHFLHINETGKWLDGKRFYEKNFANLNYEAGKPSQPSTGTGTTKPVTPSQPGGQPNEDKPTVPRPPRAEKYEDFGQPNAGTDFEYEEIPQGIRITNYIGERKDVVIPREINGVEVVELGSHSFSHKGLTSVAIPDTVTGLSDHTFHSNQISRVYIPDSIKTIPFSAFSNNHLEPLYIPDSVKEISVDAFYNNRLQNISLPDSLKTIGGYAFSNNRLTEIIIPDSVKEIHGHAFSNNRLVEITIPESIKKIGEYAFYSNRLKTLNLPNGLLYIEEHAFADNSLKTVTIPASVETIDSGAFQRNHISELILEDGVKNIYYNAFDNNRLTTVVIPASVEAIYSQAFYNNNIKHVDLPAHLTGDKLAENAFDHTVTIGYLP